jgi:ParB family transcriptional regulator, chromosome partitioning protein
MDDKKTAKKRSVLGKGLSALLDDAGFDHDKKQDSGHGPGSVFEIPVEHIRVNPFQPRTDFHEDTLEELAESIKVQGIIQPITVRRVSENDYQLISGERRLLASKRAGLKSIPAFVRAANDQQMLELALIENIQRENLNAIEIAISYQRLISECHLLQEELGDRVGKKRTTVTNYLRLLKLPPDIQAALRDDRISMGHARAIINIDNIDTQLSLFHKIVKEDLSVRKVEALVKQISEHKSGKAARRGKPDLSADLSHLQSKLSTRFATKIEIKNKPGFKGEIRIPYFSLDDLNRILDLLNK